MCVPTVIAFSDEATKDRYVAKALRGDEIWCQLFSEPGCGLRRRRWRRPKQCATAMIGSSTARKFGPLARNSADFGILLDAHQSGRGEAQRPDDVHRRHEAARALKCVRSTKLPVGASSTKSISRMCAFRIHGVLANLAWVGTSHW
jgi:hypothetical protein